MARSLGRIGAGGVVGCLLTIAGLVVGSAAAGIASAAPVERSSPAATEAPTASAPLPAPPPVTALVPTGDVAPTTPPTGNLDSVSPRVGGVVVQGWALHRQEVAPVAVHVYVDGAWGGSTVAEEPRPDVGAAYPTAGEHHGFTAVLRVGEGQHVVCAYAVSLVADGENPLLGCRSVVAPVHEPVGNLDSLTGERDHVRLVGWAFDPDTAEPIDVHVYRDGVWAGQVGAFRERLDVAAAYGLPTAAQGFAVDLFLPTGRHTFCAYGINTGPGATNPVLGCRTTGLPKGDPFGNVDRVTTGGAGGLVTVEGWAIDPDTRTPAEVHVYVDGRFHAAVRADGERPDVVAAYPTAGPAHAYRFEDRFVGVHEVCVHAINFGLGTTNTLLGCRVFLA